MPERWEGTRVVEDVHVEAILEVVVANEAKDIIVDITVIVYLFLISQK